MGASNSSMTLDFKVQIEIWSNLVKSHPMKQIAASDGSKFRIIQEISIAESTSCDKVVARYRINAVTVHV